MKKFLFCMVFAVIFMYALVCYAEGSEKWMLKITDVEGERTSCEVFTDENDRPLIPFRFVAESLGAEVSYQEESGEILLDFGTEQWIFWQPDYIKEANEKHIFEDRIFWSRCSNFDEMTEEMRNNEYYAYSDISGDALLSSAELILLLIEDTNYVPLSNLQEVARNFRSEVSVDEENHLVEFFILPLPFYSGNSFKQSLITVSNGDLVAEIPALFRGAEIEAISLEDLMVSIGGSKVDVYD